MAAPLQTKESGTVYVSSSGSYYVNPEIDADTLNDFKTNLLITFLMQYDFCLLTGVYGGFSGKIKLKSNMLKFLEELDKI